MNREIDYNKNAIARIKKILKKTAKKISEHVPYHGYEAGIEFKKKSHAEAYLLIAGVIETMPGQTS